MTARRLLPLLLPVLLPVSLIGCGVPEEGSPAPKPSPEDSGGTDGTDGTDGADGADGADGGPNTPPGAATVVLSPDRPDTDDDVRVVIVAEAADAEGDAVSYRYLWFQDGALREDLSTDTLPAAETQKGEEWRVQVVANDGASDGPPATASVTVVNALPTISGVRLDPSPAFESSVLVAVVEGADDLDGDALGFDHTWLVNGAAVSGATGDSLSGAHFDKGDSVVVRVTVSDPGGAGGSAESGALVVENSLPAGTGASISPTPVFEGSAASCVAAGWSDADGDPEAWRYSWTVNGAAAGTGAGLTGASFNKGDSLVCVATPDDGEALGSPLSSAAVVVSNTAPTLASASLSTLSPTESDTLSVVLGATSDADGDAVSLSYAWSVNGLVVASGPTLSGASFSRGDTVQVSVTPADGAASGAAVSSDTATVVNSLPTVGAVSLSPGTAYTNDTLVASALGADLDGDPVALIYAWTVNGGAVAASGSSLSGALYFDKGDVVQVTVTPDDGLGLGSGRSSAALTIQNTPPTAPVVSISPVDPMEGDALVCELVSPAADVDGDSLSYSVAWAVDGVAYIDVEDGALVGDTVPAGESVVDETWACAVTASDGSASGPAGEDEVLVSEGAYGSGTVTLTASGVEFVTVYGGTFDMGCTPGQSSCYPSESPVRTTTLTRDYYMSRTEVTQGQFAAVMGYSPSYYSSCGSSCPVEQVSWHEAARFANGVSAAAGLAACYTCSGSGSSVTCSAPSSVYSCAGYRLPTEAEWEGAARCGEDLLYAGSDAIDAVAWYTLNSGSTTRPVGGLAPNACGLYDMSGNVWEWANDWYSSIAYAGGAATDPSGAASGSGRVVRGGGWRNTPQSARVASRDDGAPALRLINLGFRLVRTAP